MTPGPDDHPAVSKVDVTLTLHRANDTREQITVGYLDLHPHQDGPGTHDVAQLLRGIADKFDLTTARNTLTPDTDG